MRHDGVSGFGEAAPIERYDESAESALHVHRGRTPTLLGDDPFALDEIESRLPPREWAARAALDAALHDLQGKLTGVPGLAAARPPARGPADVLDDLARRPRRHGAPRGARRPAGSGGSS